MSKFRLNPLTLLRIIVVLMLPLLIISACSRGNDSEDDSTSGVDMSIKTEPDPPAVGASTVTVTLTDRDGKPVTEASLALEANMSHAGMQPVFVELEEISDGVYESSEFEFTMGGDWILTISGELENGEDIHETFDLSGVSG